MKSKKYTERLQQQAKIISELDCLQSFANYKNIITLGLHLVKIKRRLVESRHPVVERLIGL